MVPKTQNKCSVCTDAEDLDNEIFCCKNCKTNVHRSCYGIRGKFDENWQCSPCKKGSRKDIVCKLCVQSGGTFKRTVCGYWCHVVCALWTEGVMFENPDEMEPINVSNVSRNKRNKTCVYCKKSQGFCCLCSNTKCKHRLHITCAQKAQALKEKLKNDEMKSIKFLAYCMDHKPVVAERKISSRSVRRVSLGTVAKKKEMKKNKENSEKIAAQWILDANTKNIVGDVGGNGAEAQKKDKSEGKSTFNAIAEDESTQDLSVGNLTANSTVDAISVQKEQRKRPLEAPIDQAPKRLKENEKESTTGIVDLVASKNSSIEGKFFKNSSLSM